jgi:hypothetical protein
MKLTELIKEAQEALEEFGDINVCVFDVDVKTTSPVFQTAGIMLAKEKEDDKEFVFCIADEDLVGSVDDAGLDEC